MFACMLAVGTAAEHPPALGRRARARSVRLTASALSPVAQGWIVRNTNAARSTRCTPPWQRLGAGPGTTVSTPTITRRTAAPSAVGSRPSVERAVEPDRGDRDGRDGQADRGHRGAVGEVEADLHPVAVRGPDRRDRLGQQHQQRDHDADDGVREARRAATASSIAGDSTLARPTTDDQRDEQQPEADQRVAARGRVGVAVAVLVRVRSVAGSARPAGRSRGAGRSG